MSVTIFEVALDAFANDPSGPIARELEKAARDIVAPLAAQTLSEPAVRVGRFWDLNPPPGPPRRRTGDLINSIEVLPATIGTNMTGEWGATVYVAADPDHGFRYGPWLLGREYRFLPDDYYPDI